MAISIDFSGRVALTHFLRASGGGRGVAALCIGGGMGIAMGIEVEDV